MLNIFSYFLFFISNFLIIFFLDNELAKPFLSIYSISGLIIGPLSFYYFSKIRSKFKFLIVIVIIINILTLLFNNFFSTLVVIYVTNLFFTDFLSSQSNKKYINFFYKFFLFFSIVPYIFESVSLENLLLLRIFIASSFLLYCSITLQKLSKLDVKSPITYLITTNINYYGGLYILTHLLSGLVLKFTYIIFQLSFSIILKFYDLKLRSIITNKQFKFFNIIIVIIGVLAPLVLINFNNVYVIYPLFYLCLFIFYLIKIKLV